MTQPAVPGDRLLEAVRVMDRLRSPGGCPWDAEQTHGSLAPYLLEEAYETLEAIENADLAALREELGDLLLQVLFHARLAEEADPDSRFGIDEVAGDLVAKLTRRHPHVFGAVTAATAEQVASNWEDIKRAEKRRSSVTEGVPLNQPALSLAAKLIGRTNRSGLPVQLPAGAGIGERLFALVDEAVRDGVDPELALRRTTLRYRDLVRAAESEARTDGSEVQPAERVELPPIS